MKVSTKQLWAQELAYMGVRAVTISDVTHISEIAARAIFKAQHGESAPPGQTPSDPNWFVKNRENSFHSAFFLSFYLTVKPHVSTRGMAFSHAYVTYLRAIGFDEKSARQTAPLPAERANLLTKLVEDQNDLRQAGRSPIRVCKCRKCRTLFVGLTNRAEAHCHFCADETK